MQKKIILQLMFLMFITNSSINNDLKNIVVCFSGNFWKKNIWLKRFVSAGISFLKVILKFYLTTDTNRSIKKVSNTHFKYVYFLGNNI